MKKKTSNLQPMELDVEKVGVQLTRTLVQADETEGVSKGELIEILSGFVCLISAVHDEIMEKLEEFE